jgi:hypothetical protein
MNYPTTKNDYPEITPELSANMKAIAHRLAEQLVQASEHTTQLVLSLARRELDEFCEYDVGFRGMWFTALIDRCSDWAEDHRRKLRAGLTPAQRGEEPPWTN